MYFTDLKLVISSENALAEFYGRNITSLKHAIKASELPEEFLKTTDVQVTFLDLG